MALSQKKKFTFTWKIQNFSMCPQKFKEALKSPVFLVPMLKNSEWQLVLYPRGRKTDKDVSCYLGCTSSGSNDGGIQIGFNILVFSDDVTKLEPREVKKHFFEKGKSFGYSCFMSRDAIFGDENAYLPNNTLTIKCSLWPSDDADGQKDSFKDERNNEDLTVLMKYNVQDSRLCGECTVVTRVQVHRRNISWPIRHFSSIDSNENRVKHVPSSLKNVPSFCITFNKSIAHQSTKLQIRKGPGPSKDTFVKCKVSVLYTSKGIDMFAEDEHLFESNVDLIWEFPFLIKLNVLEEDTYLKRTCDVLHLGMEFSFSRLTDIHLVEKIFIHKDETLVNLSGPIEEFRQLYDDGEPSDVTIRVDDFMRDGLVDFKVHKTILKARSPVIGAEIYDGKEEYEIGVDDTFEFESDTMDRMLTFMYTDAIGDMVVEDLLKLYSAAAGYQVLSLKERCASILASSLSISNVCQVLELSHKYNDDYLRECAESLIQANSVEIFKSEEWENLTEYNGSVAAKVLLKMQKN